MSDDLWTKPEADDNRPAQGQQPATPTDSQHKQQKGDNREWRLIEKLIMGLNTEQRKSRRWGIFFKSLTFIYLFAALFLFIPGDLFPK